MKRNVLIIALTVLVSCTRTILPETDNSIQGSWAHVTEDLSSADYYLKFEMGKCYTYRSAFMHYFEDNYIWDCSPDDFKLVFCEYYSIRDGVLLVSSAQDGSDAVNLGKISVKKDVLTVDGNTYYRLYGCTDSISPKCSARAVAVTPESLVMRKGETRELTATISPEGVVKATILWKSDNPQVASVNDLGSVMALSAGTACIMAQAANGVYGICSVTVNDK